MGRNKSKGPKTNVFKVAGAKSLKKSKAKAVNLGLKDIKQKVKNIDEQFEEIARNAPRIDPAKNPMKSTAKTMTKPKISTEDVNKTTEDIVKMDI